MPYRSLVPKKTKNLLVAGRCFCFEKKLVEDTRIIGTCLITGHGPKDFALIFEVVYYVLSPDYNVYMDVQQYINVRIKEEFENGQEYYLLVKQLSI